MGVGGAKNTCDDVMYLSFDNIDATFQKLDAFSDMMISIYLFYCKARPALHMQSFPLQSDTVYVTRHLAD